ncbi:hypothetical protein HYT23_02960 [Candidatus Pacearchaeota archaeon]|nr:hypothetical protein [Candidatus Pacearchaeota archaeon]
MYFTPNGGFEVKLVDVGHLNDSGRNSELIVPHYDSQRAIEREDKIYFTHTIQMEKGSRLLIPSYVAHRVIGKAGSVLMAWGSVEFDSTRLIWLKDYPDILEALSA